jgi:hypothetical protein
MPVGQENKDDLDPQEAQQDQDQDQDQAEDGDGEGAEAAVADKEDEEEEKQEVHPSLTVTSPGSGAQFKAQSAIPVEFDCEGDVQFTAHAAVLDPSGSQVIEDATDLQLEEGKGHGAFALGGDALVAGKYDVLVWGESGGQATAVQKLQVEIIEDEEEEEAAPAVAVEGDDAGDDSAPA